MAAPENWLEHVKALVLAQIKGGARPRDAYRTIAVKAGLSEEYVYQLASGFKATMGKEAAEKIARAYANGRPLDWIDRPPVPVGEAQARLVTDSDWDFLQDLKLAPEEEVSALRTSYRVRADNARKATPGADGRVFTDEQVAKALPPKPKSTR